MLLQAAATTLDLIETGEITAHGTLASLLTPEPHRPVPDGTHQIVTTGRKPRTHSTRQ